MGRAQSVRGGAWNLARRTGIVAVVLWTLTIRPSDACADDASKAVYDDAKAIFEELIERDVSNGVATEIEKQPMLDFYFHRSLERLRKGAWGSLSTTLRNDVADLAADFVYWRVKTKSTGKAANDLETFAGCFKRVSAEAPACGDIARIRESLYDPTRTERDGLKTGEELVGVSTLTESCARTELVDDVTSVGCNLAAATRSILRGERALARNYLAAVLAASMAGWYATTLDPTSPSQAAVLAKMRNLTRDAVNAWMTDALDDWHPSGATVDSPWQAILKRAAHASDCRKDTVAALLTRTSSHSLDDAFRACVAVATLRDGSLLSVTLEEKPASTNDTKQSYAADLRQILTRMTGEATPKAFLEAFAGIPASPFTCKSGVTYSLQLGKNKPVDFTCDSTAKLADLATLREPIVQIDELARIVESTLSKYVIPTEDVSAVSADAWPALISLVAEAYELTQRVRDLDRRAHRDDWTTSTGDLLGILDSALRFKNPSACTATKAKEAPQPGDACAQPGLTCRYPVTLTCKSSQWVKDGDELDDLRTLLLGGEGRLVRAYVESAFRGETRDLAVRVLGDVLLPHATEPTHGSRCGSRPELYSRLIVSFASYILDDAGDNLSRNTGREAFRGAAVDVLSCIDAGGIDRSNGQDSGKRLAPSSADGGVAVDLIPSAALRFSWNESYVNQSGGNGFRYTVSADWPAVRVRFTPRSKLYYSGMQVSLFDLVGPANELALRNVDVVYEGSGPNGTTPNTRSLFWLDFVRPRVDVMFGVPGLSNHVVLVAGGSVRAVVVEPTPVEGPADAKLHYRYHAIWNAEDAARAVEVNLGVKYVF